MDPEAACKIANKFVGGYVTENNYFTPQPELEASENFDRHVLIFTWSFVRDETVVLAFVHGNNVDSNRHDLRSHARGCQDALQAAHPELKSVSFEIEITKDPG